jgi:hypothetical protein
MLWMGGGSNREKEKHRKSPHAMKEKEERTEALIHP